MTATTPSPRTPPAVPAHGVVRRTVATVLATLLVLLVVGWPGVARADSTRAAATPAPTPTTSAQPTLAVAAQNNGLLPAGEALTARVSLQNGSTDRAAAAVTLTLGATPLTDRAALAAWLGGQGALGASADIGTAQLLAVAAGADATVDIVTPADNAALQGRAAGIYPLAATVAGADGTLTARSVVVVPQDATSAAVGVVVPVTAGPLTDGLLTSDQLAALTAADGTLTGILDAVTGTTAILAVDPAIPAAIRVLGTRAPATATTWLARLMALPNERFALQFGDADLAVQLQAGAGSPLQPASLASYMSASAFPSATPTPTPTATGSAAALPDLSALTDIGATRASVYWPVSGTAGADVVATLGGLGTPEVPAVTLVPSTTVQGGTGGTVAARQQAGEAALLAYDSAVSDALRDAAANADATERGADLATASAYLALQTQTGAPVLVVVDRTDDITRVGLSAAIRAVTTAPGARSAGLDDLVAGSAADTTVADIAPAADRVAAASALLADEDRLGDFSSVLDDPTVLMGPERAQILQLLGAGWTTDAAAAATAITEHRTQTRDRLDAVGILSPTPLNLLGQTMAYWVRNDLPWPVNVVLYATPDDLRLDVDSAITVRVDASSNKRVVIPVKDRVGNGDVTVALQLRSPTSVPIGDAQYAAVNVRADWEGWGFVVLVVLVGGLLAVGLVRTVRRRRAAAAGEGSSGGSADDSDSGGGDSGEGDADAAARP